MSKRIFVFLCFLMSVSLIGIIFIQSYFIFKNYEANNNQFTSNVNYVIDQTASMCERREFIKYVRKFKDLINSDSQIDTTSIKNLYIINDDINKNETIFYKNGVIEENIIIPKSKSYYDNFFNLLLDDEILSIKRFSNQREEKVFSNQSLDNNNISPEEFLMKVGKISKSKEILFETAYHDLAKRNSIEDRIGDVSILEKLIRSNLDKMNINLDFEYAIYNNDSITSVYSENYVKSKPNYKSLIFKDENNSSEYSIALNFPGRTPFLISSIITVLITSLIFTTIIIIAYITTIFLLLRQRQISQIKSDFINNMTHEFKTPIATINLALSAIKNPKIIVDKLKIKKYLDMIYDENNRMHDQVENVLMISHLEKNQLNIQKTKLDLVTIIELAISHVNLIIENKNGKIKINKKNNQNYHIIGNETHLINVFVNILDNAIKYNENQPEITVSIIDRDSDFYIEIEDNGIGMTKSVQSKIFNKFYRKQTGNLHDVKGHGLGLSYVKKIIDYHNGNINVKSFIDKGSIFSIRLNKFEN